MQGATVDGIIIFDMGSDWLSRLASGAVLVQAIAQYLVTLNIWSHNILLLLARRKAARAGVPCSVSRCSPTFTTVSWCACSFAPHICYIFQHKISE